MPAPTLPSENPAAAAGKPSGYALEFENVAIAFDEKVVLDGISFQLPHGETKALFGVAGSRKSTVLKLAMGLIKPDSGRIFLLGEEVTRMREKDLYELRRRVGIVFQESALFDSLKVYENVAFRLMEEKTSAEEIERRVRGTALRGIGTDLRHATVGTLRRHEKARGHRSRDRHRTRGAALRLAHRRTRSCDLEHHRRTHHEAARRS